MENIRFVDLLNKELVIAMGCTEPAASALAGARAAELLEGDVDKIYVETSRDMVKNAMGVGIPNCKNKGIQAAVSLGVAGRSIENGLGILSDVSQDQRDRASKYKVELTMVEDVPPLYIKVTLKNDNHESVAIVSGNHSYFSYLKKDGKVLVDEPLSKVSEKGKDSNFMADVSLDEIVDFATNLPKESSDLLIGAATTNLAISHHALTKEYGLAVGKHTYETLNDPPTSLDEALSLGATLAASASDARMAGCPFPVVINSGSGNQGITITLPIYTLAKYLNKTDDQLASALCIGELVGLGLTAKKDRLSALCGAFTAAIGTACGMVYLLDGTTSEMNRAINIMIANLTGIICDGAKNTCALKIYSCVQSADLALRLAMKGSSPSEESGIVGMDSVHSIDYLSRISHEGMEQTDKT
ncbi:MAG: L-serine ammonia-lyase, iron-sulfur-dependent, subunit alpha, partial [Sphaerochaetaceae bacterium]|nr:L-serine ammonia-lyase, iron-sulfur-dependent, subunit alpha [Sphaerochaetaceae bacterium]